jgi:DNA-binding HxlR family transcriptional regulator
LLVVRELMLGPKRFTDLRAGIPGVGPDLLAARLRDLEAVGVVGRTTLPPPAAARVYELTDWGRELEPVLLALGRWGSRAPMPVGPPPLSADAFALALETTYAGVSGRSGTARRYQLRLGEQDFVVTVGRGGLTVRRGGTGDARVTLSADTGTLAALVWHGLDAGEAMREGVLVLEGDAPLEEFTGLFAAPVPMAA